MSGKILSDRTFVAGWLDSTIHDFLQVMAPKGANTKYALITCLDSHRNPAALRERSPELQFLTGKVHAVGNALLIRTDQLLEAEATRRILFGFDEIWFFPQKIAASKPPAGLLVGPARLDAARFRKIGRWMSAHSCSLGLGGGEGMNFIVRAHGLSKSLLGYSIEQPDFSSAALALH